MTILENGKAILIGIEKWDDKIFDLLPNLKVIGCNATGTDHLPEKEFEKRGIKLISLKGETEFLQTITSTAEHTIGLMIALMRNYKTALNPSMPDLLFRDREYYKGHTLKNKVLGLVGGRGRVGRQVGDVALAFGMIVYQMDEGFMNNTFISIKDVDVLSIHIPLQGNEGFFTKEMFQQMKPTAYFINTSRSGVVEKGALLWALENKIIAGAAVDFIDDKELVDYAARHDNLILTNHIGGCTHEDMARTEEFIINRVKEYLHEVKS